MIGLCDMIFYVLGSLFAYFVWRNGKCVYFYLKFLSLYIYVSAHAFVFIFIALATKPFDPTTLNIVRYTTPVTNYVFGLKVDIRNAEYLDTDRGGFVVANHQYSLDVLTMCNVWPTARRMTIVGKKILFYIWPLGLASWVAGVAFIDRGDPVKSYKILQQLSELTKGEKPTKILIFPEGTRNEDCFTTKKMLPFKRGAFKMAIACQTPITPIVIGPYSFINPIDYHFGTGSVTMKILQPIETKGMTENDVNSLRDRVQKLMQDVYDELYSELVKTLPSTHPFWAQSKK